MRLFIAFLFSLAACAYGASEKVENFNQAMQENIKQVMRDNPETYEQRSPGRFPASVSPVEVEPEREKMEGSVEDLKLRNLRPGVGLPKW